MQKIMILNPKGGCGKSTISTNLASYYTNWGLRVGLADFDQQKSSLNWLRQRTFDLPQIKAINASTERFIYPETLDYLIIDTPASLDKEKMLQLIQLADSIIIPVLPSPVDIQAAGYFIYQLLLKYRVTSEDKDICMVANRVRERSTIYKELLKFTDSIKLPLVATLHDSQNYIKYASKGSSIFDHKNINALTKSIEDWMPLTNWLNSKETPAFSESIVR